MKTILKSQIFEGGKLVKSYTKNFNTLSIKENETAIDKNGLKGSVREIQVDGIYMVSRHVKIQTPYEVGVSHDFPLFKLHFEIEGYNRYEPSDAHSLPVEIKGGHFNLFYFPHVNGTLRFQPPKRKTLEIQFTMAYIKRVIGENFKDVLTEFGSTLEKKRPFVFWKQSQRITPQLSNYIQEILNCEYSNSLKKAYLEAKVLELLVVLFAQSSHSDNPKSNIPITEVVREKIEKVATYINSNLQQPLSIATLATIAGLNTSKLKESFKLIYDTTIFKYITNQRMLHAKKLIQERSCNVAEASYQVGYKNPQHFTVAFKKVFGLLPSELRKDK